MHGGVLVHQFASWAVLGHILAALVGALVWNLITWYLGLPSSSSHALVGGLVGAGGGVSAPTPSAKATTARARAIGLFQGRATAARAPAGS